MSGTLQINEALAITYNRLYIVVFTLIVFGILLLVLQADAARARDPRRRRRTARWRGRWASAASGWTR